MGRIERHTRTSSTVWAMEPQRLLPMRAISGSPCAATVFVVYVTFADDWEPNNRLIVCKEKVFRAEVGRKGRGMGP
jgi:hypothetical protein